MLPQFNYSSPFISHDSKHFQHFLPLQQSKIQNPCQNPRFKADATDAKEQQKISFFVFASFWNFILRKYFPVLTFSVVLDGIMHQPNRSFIYSYNVVAFESHTWNFFHGIRVEVRKSQMKNGSFDHSWEVFVIATLLENFFWQWKY